MRQQADEESYRIGAVIDRGVTGGLEYLNAGRCDGLYRLVTLENGLRLITSPMPHTRSASICIFLGVGSRYEPPAQAGISHFLEHLFFKGTEKRTRPQDIAAAIEGVGGILNAGTDRELTTYWCKSAAVHFPLALDVLSDMLLHSRFDAVEIERERQVIFEEIHMVKDSPHQRVGMLVDELLWPDHPLGTDVAGTAASVGAISRQSLLDFVAERYLPENAVVSVAGALSHEEATEAVTAATAEWRGGATPAGFVAFQAGKNPRLGVEERDTEQTHLSLALPGLSLRHPHRFALDLLSVILGEGMSSRLFVEIRDNLGLAYSIHSYTEHLHDTGALTIYAGVEHEKLEVAIRAIVGELRLLLEPVDDEELTKAKELSKGRLLLRMEDSRSVAGWTGGQEILTGEILSVEDVVEKVDAVTVDEVCEIAREVLVGDQLRLAVVGPKADGVALDRLLEI